MTPQELKNSILQLAIQGKVVKQRPEEGTAQELYAQIQAEKQRLIKEGKIKKEKPLPEITEDEKPFDIPEGWMWVSLTDCGCFISGYTPKLTELASIGNIPYFKVSDMNTFGNEIYLKTSKSFVIRPSKVFFKGTIVYPKNGGAVFTNKKRILAQDSVVDLNTGGYYPFLPSILAYSYYFFLNIDFRQCYKGTALPTIDMDILRKKWFPLPPLAEQKRIVAKIEELLPLVDRYEQAWTKLENFNRCFPEDMKKSILQQAIQGKLVEQRPEEGTAQELYAQIQAEKQRLIQSGKLKKEKPLPEITEDEKPFEIPEGWMWVRLREITCLNPKNDLPDELEVSFIPMALIDDGYRNSHSFKIKTWGSIKKGFTHFADGDIGIAKITPCFQNRKSVIFCNLKNGYGAGTTELSIVRVVNDLLSRNFLLYFFKSAYFIENGVKSFTGTAGQQRIHKDYLATCVLPLPPLAEQKRIVAKIEELLPLVDRYEQAWTKLEDFNRRFPEDMKKSILQQAIQGKLVEQRPEEGTAQELYAQIQAEKQRLIKEGKIKKEKPLPEITEEEKPFEIPEGWMWVRVGDIFAHNTGKAMNSSAKKIDKAGSIRKFITTSNVYWNSFDLSAVKEMFFS